MKEKFGEKNTIKVDVLIKQYEELFDNVSASDVNKFIKGASQVSYLLKSARDFMDSDEIKSKLNKFKKSTAEDTDSQLTALQFQELSKKIIEGVDFMNSLFVNIEPAISVIKNHPENDLSKETVLAFKQAMLPKIEIISRSLKLMKELIKQ